MAYAIGIVLALLVVVLRALDRLDRDRAFYPTVVVVVASYYVLFAAIGGSKHALVAELVLAAFVLIAVMGFRFSPWLIVAGLAAHGVFDALHVWSSPIPACRQGGRRSASRSTSARAGFLALLLLCASTAARPGSRARLA